jgi:hypothetical protein
LKEGRKNEDESLKQDREREDQLKERRKEKKEQGNSRIINSLIISKITKRKSN